MSQENHGDKKHSRMYKRLVAGFTLIATYWAGTLSAHSNIQHDVSLKKVCDSLIDNKLDNASYDKTKTSDHIDQTLQIEKKSTQDHDKTIDTINKKTDIDVLNDSEASDDADSSDSGKAVFTVSSQTVHNSIDENDTDFTIGSSKIMWALLGVVSAAGITASNTSQRSSVTNNTTDDNTSSNNLEISSDTEQANTEVVVTKSLQNYYSVDNIVADLVQSGVSDVRAATIISFIDKNSDKAISTKEMDSFYYSIANNFNDYSQYFSPTSHVSFFAFLDNGLFSGGNAVYSGVLEEQVPSLFGTMNMETLSIFIRPEGASDNAEQNYSTKIYTREGDAASQVVLETTDGTGVYDDATLDSFKTTIRLAISAENEELMSMAVNTLEVVVKKEIKGTSIQEKALNAEAFIEDNRENIVALTLDKLNSIILLSDMRQSLQQQEFLKDTRDAMFLRMKESPSAVYKPEVTINSEKDCLFATDVPFDIEKNTYTLFIDDIRDFHYASIMDGDEIRYEVRVTAKDESKIAFEDSMRHESYGYNSMKESVIPSPYPYTVEITSAEQSLEDALLLFCAYSEKPNAEAISADISEEKINSEYTMTLDENVVYVYFTHKGQYQFELPDKEGWLATTLSISDERELNDILAYQDIDEDIDYSVVLSPSTELFLSLTQNQRAIVSEEGLSENTFIVNAGRDGAILRLEIDTDSFEGNSDSADYLRYNASDLIVYEKFLTEYTTLMDINKMLNTLTIMRSEIQEGLRVDKGFLPDDYGDWMIGSLNNFILDNTESQVSIGAFDTQSIVGFLEKVNAVADTQSNYISMALGLDTAYESLNDLIEEEITYLVMRIEDHPAHSEYANHLQYLIEQANSFTSNDIPYDVSTIDSFDAIISARKTIAESLEESSVSQALINYIENQKIGNNIINVKRIEPNNSVNQKNIDMPQDTSLVALANDNTWMEWNINTITDASGFISHVNIAKSGVYKFAPEELAGGLSDTGTLDLEFYVGENSCSDAPNCEILKTFEPMLGSNKYNIVWVDDDTPLTLTVDREFKDFGLYIERLRDDYNSYHDFTLNESEPLLLTEESFNTHVNQSNQYEYTTKIEIDHSSGVSTMIFSENGKINGSKAITTDFIDQAQANTESFISIGDFIDENVYIYNVETQEPILFEGITNPFSDSIFTNQSDVVLNSNNDFEIQDMFLVDINGIDMVELYIDEQPNFLQDLEIEMVLIDDFKEMDAMLPGYTNNNDDDTVTFSGEEIKSVSIGGIYDIILEVNSGPQLLEIKTNSNSDDFLIKTFYYNDTIDNAVFVGNQNELTSISAYELNKSQANTHIYEYDFNFSFDSQVSQNAEIEMKENGYIRLFAQGERDFEIESITLSRKKPTSGIQLNDDDFENKTVIINSENSDIFDENSTENGHLSLIELPAGQFIVTYDPLNPLVSPDDTDYDHKIFAQREHNAVSTARTTTIEDRMEILDENFNTETNMVGKEYEKVGQLFQEFSFIEPTTVRFMSALQTDDISDYEFDVVLYKVSLSSPMEKIIEAFELMGFDTSGGLFTQLDENNINQVMEFLYDNLEQEDQNATTFKKWLVFYKAFSESEFNPTLTMEEYTETQNWLSFELFLTFPYLYDSMLADMELHNVQTEDGIKNSFYELIQDLEIEKNLANAFFINNDAIQAFGELLQVENDVDGTISRQEYVEMFSDDIFSNVLFSWMDIDDNQLISKTELAESLKAKTMLDLKFEEGHNLDPSLMSSLSFILFFSESMSLTQRTDSETTFKKVLTDMTKKYEVFNELAEENVISFINFPDVMQYYMATMADQLSPKYVTIDSNPLDIFNKFNTTYIDHLNMPLFDIKTDEHVSDGEMIQSWNDFYHLSYFQNFLQDMKKTGVDSFNSIIEITNKPAYWSGMPIPKENSEIIWSEDNLITLDDLRNVKTYVDFKEKIISLVLDQNIIITDNQGSPISEASIGISDILYQMVNNLISARIEYQEARKAEGIFTLFDPVRMDLGSKLQMIEILNDTIFATMQLEDDFNKSLDLTAAYPISDENAVSKINFFEFYYSIADNSEVNTTEHLSIPVEKVWNHSSNEASPLSLGNAGEMSFDISKVFTFLLDNDKDQLISMDEVLNALRNELILNIFLSGSSIEISAEDVLYNLEDLYLNNISASDFATRLAQNKTYYSEQKEDFLEKLLKTELMSTSVDLIEHVRLAKFLIDYDFYVDQDEGVSIPMRFSNMIYDSLDNIFSAYDLDQLSNYELAIKIIYNIFDALNVPASNLYAALPENHLESEDDVFQYLSQISSRLYNTSPSTYSNDMTSNLMILESSVSDVTATKSAQEALNELLMRTTAISDLENRVFSDEESMSFPLYNKLLSSYAKDDNASIEYNELIELIADQIELAKITAIHLNESNQNNIKIIPSYSFTERDVQKAKNQDDFDFDTLKANSVIGNLMAPEFEYGYAHEANLVVPQGKYKLSVSLTEAFFENNSGLSDDIAFVLVEIDEKNSSYEYEIIDEWVSGTESNVLEYDADQELYLLIYMADLSYLATDEFLVTLESNYKGQDQWRQDNVIQIDITNSVLPTLEDTVKYSADLLSTPLLKYSEIENGIELTTFRDVTQFSSDYNLIYFVDFDQSRNALNEILDLYNNKDHYVTTVDGVFSAFDILDIGLKLVILNAPENNDSVNTVWKEILNHISESEDGGGIGQLKNIDLYFTNHTITELTYSEPYPHNFTQNYGNTPVAYLQSYYDEDRQMKLFNLPALTEAVNNIDDIGQAGLLTKFDTLHKYSFQTEAYTNINPNTSIQLDEIYTEFSSPAFYGKHNNDVFYELKGINEFYTVPIMGTEPILNYYAYEKIQEQGFVDILFNFEALISNNDAKLISLVSLPWKNAFVDGGLTDEETDASLSYVLYELKDFDMTNSTAQAEVIHYQSFADIENINGIDTSSFGSAFEFLATNDKTLGLRIIDDQFFFEEKSSTGFNIISSIVPAASPSSASADKSFLTTIAIDDLTTQGGFLDQQVIINVLDGITPQIEFKNNTDDIYHIKMTISPDQSNTKGGIMVHSTPSFLSQESVPYQAQFVSLASESIVSDNYDLVNFSTDVLVQPENSYYLYLEDLYLQALGESASNNYSLNWSVLGVYDADSSLIPLGKMSPHFIDTTFFNRDYMSTYADATVEDWYAEVFDF